MTAAGVGLRLKPSAPIGAIAAAVHQLLDEPSFRAHARELGARIRADAASTVAIEELEAVAGGAPPADHHRPQL